MPIQIVLGAADRRLVESVGGRVRELADVEVAAVEATSGHVVSTVAAMPSVDVVLVHEALGPLPALDLIRDLIVRRPQLAVVLIADTASADTFAAAMAAGARGVVSNDPTLPELQSRIVQAAEWSRTMRRHFASADAGSEDGGPGRLGRLVTLCGAKGGSGTTTLAIHAAVAVAGTGRTVCLVEMDLQKGDIAAYLDVQHRHSIADLAAAAGDLDGGVVAEALFVHPLGPHLLLAPERGEDAEEISARTSRRILTLIRSRYDVVIVDAGTYVTDANAVAVELADEAVVIATPDVPALRSVRRLTDMWSRLAIRKKDEVSVLLAKHGRRNEIQPELARRMVGSPLRKVTVPACFRALEEAANTGRPEAVRSAEFRKAVGQLAADLGLLGDGARPRQGAAEARDGGAVALEFAGLFPLIGLIMLLVWQVVLVGVTSMYSSHAANKAARAVAVLGYDQGGTAAARANREEVRRRAVAGVYGKWKDPDHLHIAVQDGYARVTIDTPVMLPGWYGPWGITAKARIVDERLGEPR
ncbi:AAA family ATPase [Actinomadura violacea]|uniref:AAA family ATPase n=1 Tax=Actinomadura violacea TaxID=2819934 RepID=A0ABS3S450_9ACTN|nr:AAA family ATPase [Actinomadura violacea]MBO2463769.1 AAA family ATPase [Actinomadura violacea]